MSVELVVRAWCIDDIWLFGAQKTIYSRSSCAWLFLLSVTSEPNCTISQTSVLLVSFGVVLATLSRPSTPRTNESPQDIRKYVTGVAMLVVSLFLTGLLGLMQERTYRRYGPCWREGVFYTVRGSSDVMA